MSQLTDNLATLNDGELLAQFARTGSQEAFAAMVSRHGGLVIGVCRRVLGNVHGAEDAAQAVFLTLAQKAGELSGRESVAGWLHKVAWHVAIRAREAAAIRREHEQEVAEMKSHETPREATWEDLRPVLDEELAALPEKYRVPLVLHHLEGRTIEEAAKLMNCSAGTMASWISRGREQLRTRLARRKLELPVATLPGLMAMGVGAGVSLTFVASTAKAASLLAEGNAAAGGAVSAQVTALFKGTMKMMMLSKLKAAAALVLVAMLPFAAAGSAWYFTGQAQAANPANPQPGGAQLGGPQTGGNGGNGGGGIGNPGGAVTEKITSTAWPLTITPVDSQHLHSEAMHRTIDVSYRRAYVSEVVSDLERRTGVRVAYAQPLGDGWTFSMEAKGVDAKQVLEKLATDGKFDLAEHGDLEVLSQKADDMVISDLTKQLGSADRWERANAVWALGNLADLRIYPLLTKALGDPDVGVSEWAMRALEKHSRMASVMDDQGKDAIIKTVGAWLKSIQQKTDYQLTGYAWATWGNLATGDRKDRLELLAATRKPESRAILFDTLRTVKNQEGAMRFIVREAAVKALKADPETATEAITLIPMFDGLIAGDAKLPPGRGWMPNQELNLKLEVIKVLLSFEVPEIKQTAQTILNKSPRSFMDEQVVALVVKEYPLNMDFHELAKQKVVGLDGLYKEVEKPEAEKGKPAGLMGPLPGFQAIQALKLLDLIPDPEVTKALLKLVKDEKAMALIDKASGWATDVAIPLSDPEIVAALQARLALKMAGGQLAAHSLGQSHDPKIADALIAQLKDTDDAWVATVADALAQTRDPRALAAIAATVRENREWSDFEGDDKADAKGGMQMQFRTNPDRLLVRAIPETRDPGVVKELAAMAIDLNLNPEVQLTAQQQLRGAPETPAEMDTLMDLLKTAKPKLQREILLGGLPNSAMPYLGMGVYVPPVNPTQHFINDPRLIALWTARIPDDEADLRAAGPVKQLMRNAMVDLAPSFSSPAVEKTLLDLCKNPDEHVAFFAARGLGRFQDPKITIEYTQ